MAKPEDTWCMFGELSRSSLHFFVQDHYIFNLPVHYEKVWPAALIIVIANLWISKYSGYQPEGKFNQINFIVAYPVIEEIIFRGLIIPILNQSLLYTTSFEVLYLPVSVPIVISAVLFAIAHLQYYKLNQSSIRYMLFAFAGGVVFGAVTDLTQSILIAVMLHIQFNMMSVCYSISGRKDRNGKQL